MIKLDDNLLAELGLQTLPPEEKKNLLRHIYETLEMRVGTTLAQQMTDAQLDEFEGFINANDEPGALKWLETNFPNYKDVVAQEFERLKAEVRQSAPQILANVAANSASMPPLQPQPGYAQQQQYQQAPMPQASPYAQPQPSYPGPMAPQPAPVAPAQQPYYPPAGMQQPQMPPTPTIQQQPTMADTPVPPMPQQQYQPQYPTPAPVPSAQPVQQDIQPQTPQQPAAIQQSQNIPQPNSLPNQNQYGQAA